MASQNSSSLKGKTAVITGAGGGIGEAIATHLGALGARLALLDLDLDRIHGLAERLRASGVEALPLVCDVSSEASVSAAAHATAEALGGADVLVNNAGILAPPVKLAELTLQAWERTFAVNSSGVFLCTREFGAQMCARRSGSIVNIASIAASAPNASPPYSASKASVLALTRHTAVEWGPMGVRANAVSPGFIRTALSEAQYAQGDLLARREAMVPLRRIGLPEDIARVTGFLAGDDAAFLTGQDIQVDGGFLQTLLRQAQPGSSPVPALL